MGKFHYTFQSDDDIPALTRLADRMTDPRVKGWPLDEPISRRLPGAPDHDDFPVRRRRLLQYDGAEIRAFHNFFEHELYVDGTPHSFIWPNTPLSESVVDQRFALNYPMLLRHSLELKPLHIAFSGLKLDTIPGKLYAGMKWKYASVPYFFLPLAPGKVLLEAGPLKRSPALRLAAKAAIATGFPSLATFASTGWKRHLRRGSLPEIEVCNAFDDWTDRVWHDAMPHYRAVPRRDAEAMNRLYRPGDRRYDRLRLKRGGQDMGWVLLSHAFPRTPRPDMDLGYGSIRPAAIIDCMAKPEDARTVIAAALEFLKDKEVDMPFARFSHRAWQQACDDLGFLRRTNRDYMIFVSKAGQDMLLTEERPVEALHLTEGDCDGPYYLVPEEQL